MPGWGAHIRVGGQTLWTAHHFPHESALTWCGIYHVMSVNHFCWLNANGLSCSDHMLGYIKKIWDSDLFTWHFTTNWNPLLKCHTNFPAKGVFEAFLTECKIWQSTSWLTPWKPEIFKCSAINKVTLIILSFVKSV